MDYKIIIPARYSSGRLPGKPLVDLNGKTMIERVYEQASKSNASRIIIATDDERIQSVARRFGAEVCMTHPHHLSGTDRLQEVVGICRLNNNDTIVNVQGDEPFIPPQVIDQVAKELIDASETVAMATLSCPIVQTAEIFDPSVVKVVTDKEGNALYFSRAPLPWDRDSFANKVDQMPMNWVYQRHIGIYAYRVKQLNAFVQWGESPLEVAERLEQLRFLWNGRKIRVGYALQVPPAGIDTPEDVDVACEYLKQQVLPV